MTDLRQPATPEQRQRFRRVWTVLGLLFVLALVGPQWLFRSGKLSGGLLAGAVALPAWFIVAGLVSDRCRNVWHSDHDLDAGLLGFLCCCALLGSLLSLIFRFMASH